MGKCSVIIYIIYVITGENVCVSVNIYKMQLTHMHYNLRKHFFSNRIITVWNSLPNIIVNAESTNIFKINWIFSG